MRLHTKDLRRTVLGALITAFLVAMINQPVMAVMNGDDTKTAFTENSSLQTGPAAEGKMLVDLNASKAIGNLTPVAAFEGGIRYKAGAYDVIVLNGTYREMGRQYGALMEDELQSVYSIIENFSSERGYSAEQIREIGSKGCEYQPERMKSIYEGMAETSGIAEEDVNVLYYGPVLFVALPNLTRASCSFLAAWGNYTPDGALVVSRNWDLPDIFLIFNPYYVLVIYNPTDGSNGVATFGPVGSRPETLMNSAGLLIADDNSGQSGGDLVLDNRPDIISQFFRLMLDYSTLEQLDAGIMSTRPDSSWIVNVAGPDKAYSYEMNLYETKRREGPDLIAAANHFLDPTWHIEISDEDSFRRYNNLLNLSEENRGSIDASKMMEIRDVLIEDGGATFHHYTMGGMNFSTNHQVVFVPETRILWMKTAEQPWQEVNLSSLFS
ncbi:MAG: C45 family autoproteolytic acyltransferase/hydrolase [Methanothrix sp.]